MYIYLCIIVYDHSKFYIPGCVTLGFIVIYLSFGLYAYMFLSVTVCFVVLLLRVYMRL